MSQVDSVDGGQSSTPEKIKPHDLVAEMESSYLDYSMSVIVHRALPDVRDGLKPVHRRILYGMDQLSLGPGNAHKKSARIVGEVLGKYHPHGDSAVYDAMVRMAQDFSIAHPLVDGQGNFGSIDGDNAAAYRYTEARLSPIAASMLEDLDRDTVDFTENFDGREMEPSVLPSRLPNLLVNGSEGIAVGMSTKVPPHNLREIARAVALLCDEPDADDDAVYTLIKGPDFPTGGLVLKGKGIRTFQRSGRGKMINRGRAHIEKGRGGKISLVFTEVPYGIIKANVLSQIQRLVRDHKSGKKKRGAWSDWIADLRDESDREGIRVVVELKRGADAAKVLKMLYKRTTLQVTYGGRLLALKGGAPKTFSLRQALEEFIAHRIEVVVRRARYDLEKARERAHILEGLLIAVDNIERVVEIIKGSKKRQTAARKLEKEFDLTEVQSGAILNLRLAQLTALDVSSLRTELTEKRALIKKLEAFLDSPDEQRRQVRDETLELADEYGRPRRTQLVAPEEADALMQRTADEYYKVFLSSIGLARCIPEGGRIRFRRKKGEVILTRVAVKAGDRLVLFADDGQAYSLYPEDVPNGSGTPMHRAVEAFPKDGQVLWTAGRGDTGRDLSVVFVSENGYVKRTAISEYASPRAGGIAAVRVDDDDRLVRIFPASEGEEVLLATANGKSIRFNIEDVPEQGRAARGVRGIKLKGDDRVVSAGIVRGPVVVLTGGGYGKIVPLDAFPVQKRAGQGVILQKVTDTTGPVIGGVSIADTQAVAVLGDETSIRVAPADLVEQDRNTLGEPEAVALPENVSLVFPVSAERKRVPARG